MIVLSTRGRAAALAGSQRRGLGMPLPGPAFAGSSPPVRKKRFSRFLAGLFGLLGLIAAGAMMAPQPAVAAGKSTYAELAADLKAQNDLLSPAEIRANEKPAPSRPAKVDTAPDNPGLRLGAGVKQNGLHCEGTLGEQGLEGVCTPVPGRAGPFATAFAEGGLGYITPWGVSGQPAEAKAMLGLGVQRQGSGKKAKHGWTPFLEGELTQPLGFSLADELGTLKGPWTSDTMALYGGYQYTLPGGTAKGTGPYGGIRFTFRLN